MIKRIQNKIAESRHTLPIAVVYGIAIWLLAGLISEQWWIQFGCFILSIVLMTELNNQNVLIRIYSRTVSSAYIFLTCAATFLLPSLSGAVIQLCFIAAFYLLCQTYQDKEAVGKIFHAFACLGIAGLIDIQFIYYLAIIWLLMGITIYSLSIRTFLASLLGFITPFWFCFAWHLYQGGDDLLEWMGQISAVADIHFPVNYAVLSLPCISFFAFLIILYIIGAVHFFHTSYNDKIRVRQIYYSLILLSAFSCMLTAITPELYDITIRLMIVTVSPIIAHFISLTYTKLTNVMFLIILGITIILTGLNLWMPSSLF